MDEAGWLPPPASSCVVQRMDSSFSKHLKIFKKKCLHKRICLLGRNLSVHQPEDQLTSVNRSIQFRSKGQRNQYKGANHSAEPGLGYDFRTSGESYVRC